MEELRKEHKNRIGEVHSYLTVISFSHYSKSKQQYWNVRCVCGKEKCVQLSAFVSKHTKSCGCLAAQIKANAIGRTRFYYLLISMKSRCYNSNSKSFKNYGGRGIRVCDEWLNDSLSFIEWCKNQKWAKGSEIDRKDNDGDYSPENCRVTNRVNNIRNRRCTLKVTYQGESVPLIEACEKLNLDYDHVRMMMKRRGRSFEYFLK